MTSDGSCVFCEIAAGRVPARITHEDGLSICLLDINPLSRGHCLVIPRRHVPWWHDLTSEETESLFALARTVAGRMMVAFRPDFVCTYARGRRIPHTHLFLVPTWRGDVVDRVFNALEGVQESAGELVSLRDPAEMDDVMELLRNG